MLSRGQAYLKSNPDTVSVAVVVLTVEVVVICRKEWRAGCEKI